MRAPSTEKACFTCALRENEFSRESGYHFRRLECELLQLKKLVLHAHSVRMNSVVNSDIISVDCTGNHCEEILLIFPNVA